MLKLPRVFKVPLHAIVRPSRSPKHLQTPCVPSSDPLYDDNNLVTCSSRMLFRHHRNNSAVQSLQRTLADTESHQTPRVSTPAVAYESKARYSALQKPHYWQHFLTSSRCLRGKHDTWKNHPNTKERGQAGHQTQCVSIIHMPKRLSGKYK